MDQPQIRDLAALLRVLNDPNDSVSLFRLLAHSAWSIPSEDLLVMTRRAREQKTEIYPVLKTISDGEISADALGAVRKLLDQITQLREAAGRMEIDLLATHLVSESFLKVIFLLPPAEQGDPWVLLGRFLRLVARYVQTYPKAARLADFLVYLECLEKAPAADFGSDEESNDARQDGVRLMTVHQAKGLEFDEVILLGMVQNRFPSRAKSESIPFPLDLMKESLPKGDYHLQEERRLCYVACTRARRRLILLTQERPRYRPSVFLREMAAGAPAEEWKEFRNSAPAGTVEETTEAVAAEPLTQQREWLSLLDRLRRTGPENADERKRLIGQIQSFAQSIEPAAPPQSPSKKSFPLPERLSFSQMETYRYCPLKYLYAYIYRIPVKSAPYMLFGTDLHDTLEWFYQQRIEGNTPPLNELASHYEKLYAQGRYGETYVDAQYKKLGDQILQAYYRKHEKNWTTPLFLEKEFTLKVGDLSVQGFIDRIDPLPDGGVEIIDYKSGKPKSDADSDEQLQIRLYALAARDLFGLEPKRATFYYLRDQSALSFPQKPADLDATRDRVFELTQQIRSGNFDPTPSAVKCKWCDFKTLCLSSKA
jgi:DNA helicase-2/ATP-dependent DNA helicase PcrA